MKYLTLFLALLSATACKSQNAADMIPAVRINPSDAANVELGEVISAALNNTTVSLSANALTQSNQLIIERAAIRNLHGRVATGRLMDAPQVFELYLKQGQCLVKNRNDGETYALTHSVCHPVE